MQKGEEREWRYEFPNVKHLSPSDYVTVVCRMYQEPRDMGMSENRGTPYIPQTRNPLGFRV